MHLFTYCAVMKAAFLFHANEIKRSGRSLYVAESQQKQFLRAPICNPLHGNEIISERINQLQALMQSDFSTPFINFFLLISPLFFRAVMQRAY